MKLVVDNSVAMRWLFADGSEADRQYASEVAALVETCEVHVPALFVTEAANVILGSGIVAQVQAGQRRSLHSSAAATPAAGGLVRPHHGTRYQSKKRSMRASASI